MSKKHELRKQRVNTVINRTSSKQEARLGSSLDRLCDHLVKKFRVNVAFESQWFLKDIVVQLRKKYPEVDFFSQLESSSMRPDGGILSLVDKEGAHYPILITEVKNQGTNDLRALEGKGKQARGNAIERLGKNVIGFRTALLHESIFPFVCFGDGCDFGDDSSIIDRVVTISMFAELNVTRLHNQGDRGQFNRGSFYFRVPLWTEDEMFPIMKDIAERSILYYFSKYKNGFFTPSRP